MPLFEGFPIPGNNKNITPVIFVVETSDVLSGHWLSAVEEGLRKTMKAFIEDNRNRLRLIDSPIKVAVLEYFECEEWLRETFSDPEEVRISLIPGMGRSLLSKALTALDQGLSRDKLFAGVHSWRTPLICFICSRDPSCGFRGALRKLKENHWFRVAKKYAVTMSEGSAGDGFLANRCSGRKCKEALAELVGEDRVVLVDSPEEIIPLLPALCSEYFTAKIGATSTLFNATMDPSGWVEDFDSDELCETTVLIDEGWEDFDSDWVARSVASSFDDGSIPPPPSIALFDFGDACTTVPPSKAPGEDFDSDRVALSCAIDDGWDDDLYQPIKSNIREDFVKNQYSDFDPFGFAESGPLRPGHSTMPPPPPPVSHSSVPTGGGRIEYCTGCGSELMAGQRFCPYCGAKRVAFCSNCGAPLVSGASFCHCCGFAVGGVPTSSPCVSKVEFSAVVPQRIVKGEWNRIELCLYEEKFRRVVDRLIENAPQGAQELVGSPQEVAKDTKIRISLTSADLQGADVEETQVWIGSYLVFRFPIMVPRDYDRGQICFVAKVYFNDVIATTLRLFMDTTSLKEQKLLLERDDVLTAFLSYASQDRDSVLDISRGMQKARPDMDIFLDVDKLRSGENWETILREEIEKRDVLYLFWSKNAQASEWVDKEWRYALALKGLDAIEPIPLVQAADCPPPEELKSKHFNDRALFYKKL